MSVAKRRRLDPVATKERAVIRPRALPRSRSPFAEEKGGPLLPPPYLQARRSLITAIASQREPLATETSSLQAPTSHSPGHLDATPTLQAPIIHSPGHLVDLDQHLPRDLIESPPSTVNQVLQTTLLQTPLNLNSTPSTPLQEYKFNPWQPKITNATALSNETFASTAKTILSTASDAVSTMLQALKSPTQECPAPGTPGVAHIVACTHDMLDDVLCDLVALLSAMGVDAIEDEEPTSPMQVIGLGALTPHQPGIIECPTVVLSTILRMAPRWP